MRIPRPRRLPALLAVTVLGTGVAVATAAPVSAAPANVLHAAQSRDLTCVARPYEGPSVDRRTVSSTVTGTVQVRLAGGGDWDLAVFDGRTGTVVAGSAGYRTRELAEGFVTRGQDLVVQGCRFRGGAATATLSVEFFAAPPAPAAVGPVQVVSVATPTRADRATLQSLGLDLTEHARPGSRDVVLRGDDARKLTAAGLRYEVTIPDLAARSTANRQADRAYAASTGTSGLPSGRTSYRRLFDYQLEMKRLAIRYPTLVRPLTLAEPTVEGRDVEGIEITADAPDLADGKPVFLDLGAHHAREWPSAEHVLEFGYDLVRSYRTDPVARRTIAAARTVLVPVVNPDGFVVSREAPSGGDLGSFDYEYKRKNCRATDAPAEYRGGTCGANPAGVDRGTDLNRNYAGFWGGPGASPLWFAEDYRGAAPFSEPESRNIRQLVSTRQVATLVTNHTYSGLVLRPPGILDVQPPQEDSLYRALATRLAGHNGYANLRGYELYDTTGSTEDWSYWNTGGLGFTFEIGTQEFHPPYRDGVVAEYLGRAPAPGAGRGGNRAAYWELLRAAADRRLHGTITGTAPAGSVLRVHKHFSTPTSPVIGADGTVGSPITYTDVLDTSYRAPGGAFRFAVNPSTRPYVAGRLGRDPVAPPQTGAPLANPAGVPAENPGDPVTGPAERIPVTVLGPPQADNGTATVTIRWADPSADWDLYVLDAGGSVIGASANGDTTSESARFLDPPAGAYTVVVVNYEGGAAADWTGGIEFASPRPSTAGTTETWTLTCQSPSGTVRASRAVLVERGGTVDVGRACRPAGVK